MAYVPFTHKLPAFGSVNLSSSDKERAFFSQNSHRVYKLLENSLYIIAQVVTHSTSLDSVCHIGFTHHSYALDAKLEGKMV